jgi:serine/threonine-protein kinase
MGEVLLARRRGAHGFEKLIAVKTIRGDLVRRDDIRRMFLDEARLMARLDHPAIAQVYDFGEEKETLYLAMEYVPGVVLSKLMKMKSGGLPPSVAARIAVEVCRGLHAAHELADPEGKLLNVVHRDISPHNLMITFDGKVKILDFGIALRRGREAPETELGVVKGKATYVAPEQLAQQKIDRRSDIYSVAVVLHEMLTGKKLFSGTGNPVVDAEERRTVPPPSKIGTNIPPELDEVVMKGMAVDPAARYQDARELARALERCPVFAGETVEEFAAHELAAEKASHRIRLASITAAAPALPPAEKSMEPISLASADLISLSAEKKVPPKTKEDRAREPTPVSSASSSGEKPAGGSRTLPWIVAALLIAIGVVFYSEVRKESDSAQHEAVALKEAEDVARELRAALNTNILPEVRTASPAATATLAFAAMIPATATVTSTIVLTSTTPEEIAETEESVEETPPIPAPLAVQISPQKQKPSPVRPRVQEKRKPARQQLGYISFEATPNAIVVIDGKVAGYTPLRDFKVSVGKHEIQLRKPYSRVLRLKRTVWVGENKRIRITSTEKTK